jgi:uncharacterized protein YlzI (FlbEa/FlbD family)
MGVMKKPEDAEVVKRLEDFFDRAKNYWKPHHDRFSWIKKFVKSNEPGAQWDQNVWRKRTAGKYKRITLTENLLGPFVNREVNKLKKSNFGIQVKPDDEGTDVELAQMRQELHRGIAKIGKWKQMINQAADDLITGGLCATRILTDYADPKSFKKEFRFLAVDPPQMFHGDGSHRSPDFSDVTDSVIYETYSKHRFKAEFNQDPNDFLGQCNEVWGNYSNPRVIEYFFKEETPDTLVRLINGKDMYLSEVSEIVKNPAHPFFAQYPDLAMLAQAKALKPADLFIMDPEGKPITRETNRCQVWWAKLAGKKVLKLEAWPGYYIPNFMGTGRQLVDKGETYYYGLAAPAVDSQQAHNYAVSSHVERLSFAPKIPIWMPIEGVPSGHEDAWQNINTSNQAVAFYHAYDPTDPTKSKPIPPPQRTAPVQSDPGFIDQRGMSEQGIKGTLGMWESALSAPSDERSGIAIRAREAQADNGNFDWGENLSTMVEHMGYVIDEMLNKVIDVPTQVLLIGEDDKEKVIKAAALEEGDPNNNGYLDLNRGKFKITCKMTTSSDTKRDEAVRGMQGLFQTAPQMAEALADFYVQEQDWRLSQEAAQRIKRFLGMKYPGLVEQEGEQPIPPQAQQQMQQMQQQLQMAQQQMQQMQQQMEQYKKLELESERIKIENQSIKADKQIESQKIAIEKYKADTDRMKAEAEIQVKQESILLKSEDQSHHQIMDKARLLNDVNRESKEHEQSQIDSTGFYQEP